LLLAIAAPARADAAPEVELLTMGTGDDVFASFGHAALRVREAGRDRVYNYGYTRFDDPRLVLDFLRGRARFWVGRQSFRAAVEDYRVEDRAIERQRLALDAAGSAELARLLEENLRPERRHYRYHHFADNCATRLRDLIDRASGGAVRRALVGKPTGQSFRTLCREGFANRLGVVLLGELLLGRELDRPIDAWQGSFLPRILSAELQAVTLAGRPLAEAPVPVHRRGAPLPGAGLDPRRGLHLLWGLVGAALALAAGLVLAVRRRLRSAGLLLAPLALGLGLTACLVYTLVGLTLGHLPELSGNENLLHLWPTDLLLLGFAFRLLRGRFFARRLLRGYALLRVGVAALSLLAHAAGLLLQPLPPVVLSLGLGLALLCVARSLPATWTRPASETRPCEPASG
jgi:hypothetical protein